MLRFLSGRRGNPTTSENEDLSNWECYDGEQGSDNSDSPVESLTREFVSDPSCWKSRFEIEWDQFQRATLKPCRAVGDVSETCGYLRTMCRLLVMEVNSHPEASIGDILEVVFTQDVFQRVILWATALPPVFIPICQVKLLRTYATLIRTNHSQTHCLLVHKPILLPLLELLQWCEETGRERCFQESGIDKHLVHLLHQICIKISRDTRLLDFFFKPRSFDDTDDYKEQKPFIVFNMLINYIHGYNRDVTNEARSAILLILSASKDLEFVAEHVANESGFCPILATGLSGCYSDLPGFICDALAVRAEEFHKIFAREMSERVPELANFHRALMFCNEVVKITNGKIAHQIVKYFYDSFLVEVIKPSLLQSDPLKLLSRIAYFHLCFETVTEPVLILAMLKLLTSAETPIYDMNLMDVMLERMNSSDQICRVVLSFLRTLLELRSEDFMWCCFLRYALPFVKLRPHRFHLDTNLYVSAAAEFLECIPDCIRNITELVSEQTFEVYKLEAAEILNSTRRNCADWAFKYDCITPNNILNMNFSEDLLMSARQPFARHSSARSSRGSTAWNRYFTNRSAHATSDSFSVYAPDSARLPLNQLGEEDPFSNLSDEDQFLPHEEETVEIDDPPSKSIHGNPYFQFAYDLAAESDGSPNSFHDDDEMLKELEAEKLSATVRIPIAAEKQKFLKDVHSQDWLSAIGSSETLLGTLNRISFEADAVGKISVEESLSLINARHQHVSELKGEVGIMEKQKAQNCLNPLKLDFGSNAFQKTSNGILMTCTTEKGAGMLFDGILSSLELLTEHSFVTNVQLCYVLEAFCSYPQPVICSLLLFPNATKDSNFTRLSAILQKLRLKIDAFASSADNFEDLVRRGSRCRQSGVPPKRTTNGRSTFRHLQMREETNRLSVAGLNKTKMIAYAAIVLSQLCQMLAAFALQHCPIYSTN